MSTAQLKAIATGTATKQDLAAMSPKKQIAHLLEQRKTEIAKMLPRHLTADRLLKVAQIAATTTPALLECEIPSLISAIGQCAQMGLEPNTVLGHAYLVPFKTKRKDKRGNEHWVKSVQVIIGYKGLIDLARRSGQIVSIAAHEVCEHDQFELVYGLEEKLEHRPSRSDRGPIIGFYAVAKLTGGGHAFEFMSNDEIQQIMLGSQSKGAYGPWKDNYTEMGRKTVIRRLAKYLPLSIEFQSAVALDDMAERGTDQRLDENTIDGDYVFDINGHGQTIDPAASDTDEPEKSTTSKTMKPNRKVDQDGVVQDAPPFDYQAALGQIQKAATMEKLNLLAEGLRDAPEDTRIKLEQAYNDRKAELEDIPY